jgi:hypothetical protein
VIQLPRRSVTRFFIPLIDVLTLMFCIFLLMPIVEDRPGGAGGTQPGSLEGGERQELAELRRKVAEMKEPGGLTEQERQELERIRADKIEALQKRLAIRVLEIDADTGKLSYEEPEGRVEIGNEAQAHELIRRQKQEAAGTELYYLFLFPRKLTGYPEDRQVRQYETWFKDVAHGIDNPRGGR